MLVDRRARELYPWRLVPGPWSLAPATGPWPLAPGSCPWPLAPGSCSCPCPLRQRQQRRDLGVNLLLAVDGDQAAVQLDQAARDVQAQPRAVGPARRVVLRRRADVGERLEQARALRRRDADAVVAHAQARPSAGETIDRRAIDRELDAAGFGRV